MICHVEFHSERRIINSNVAICEEVLLKKKKQVYMSKGRQPLVQSISIKN